MQMTEGIMSYAHYLGGAGFFRKIVFWYDTIKCGCPSYASITKMLCAKWKRDWGKNFKGANIVTETSAYTVDFVA